MWARQRVLPWLTDKTLFTQHDTQIGRRNEVQISFYAAFVKPSLVEDPVRLTDGDGLSARVLWSGLF